MNKQLGFYFDSERCVQCHACEVACKSANNLDLGIKWRTVVNIWQGTYPETKNKTISFCCLHCVEPACVAACPTGAIQKRERDGVIVIDQDKCIGCHCCFLACPFGIPQFGRDGKMQKCNLCVSRLDQGKEPACSATCSSEALRFGDIRELADKAFTRSAKKIASAVFYS
ncbi:MAG: 4Fe-4S dicluster domain-containing protein [Deltaproteobacteria bacterium]|nr:4Fe-4S dicluster domain-containing protein [Deltaproteobacteria bacterium]